MKINQSLNEFQPTSEKLLAQVWGGYGEVKRLWFEDAPLPRAVLKHLRLPQPENHPRGWRTSRGHQRKLDSFQVELNWYRSYSQAHTEKCICPQGLAIEQDELHISLLMSDLAAQGLTEIRSQADWPQWRLCLEWLAQFHARYLGHPGEGLWGTGGYWHLATRPDEYQKMAEGSLRDNAGRIDKMLRSARYQTLIHGDAKLANFCFAEDFSRAGAVDFQWTGKGPGILDVMLFISSCVPMEKAAQLEQDLLDIYFKALGTALKELQPQAPRVQIIDEWRALYTVAWADFCRFLLGWSPQHWKLCDYSLALAEKALSSPD